MLLGRKVTIGRGSVRRALSRCGRVAQLVCNRERNFWCRYIDREHMQYVST
jgi:hypothetical protein